MGRIGIYQMDLPRKRPWICPQYSINVDINLEESNVEVVLRSAVDGSPLKSNGYTDSDFYELDRKTYTLEELFGDYIDEGCQFSLYITKDAKLSVPIRRRDLECREGYSLIQLNDIQDGVALVKFMRFAEDYCVLSDYRITSSKHEVLNSGTFKTHIAWQDFFPDNKDRIDYYSDKRLFKRKILYEANPNNSLAAVDAQLDLLSTIVFSMFNKLSEESKQEIIQEFSGDFNGFKTAVESTNLTTVKNIDSCINEIKGKSVLRELQQEYYKIKNSL